MSTNRLTPQEEFPVLFPRIYAETVWSIYKHGMDFADSLGDEWRAQYLLSLVAHALAHSSFDNAGPAGHRGSVRSCAISPDDNAVDADGSTAAIVGEDGRIRLWNVRANTVRDPGLRHPGAALSCTFSSDNSSLATSGGDGRTIVWDLACERRRLVLEGHTGWVWTCAIAPDGTWLVSGGDDGTILVWDSPVSCLWTCASPGR